MFKIAGWVIWALVTLYAVSFVFGCRTYAKAGQAFHMTTGVQTFLLCLISALFLALNWHKLHMLWVVPIVYFGASFLVLSNIPVLSPLILGATRIFLKIALIGIK